MVAGDAAIGAVRLVRGLRNNEAIGDAVTLARLGASAVIEIGNSLAICSSSVERL